MLNTRWATTKRQTKRFDSWQAQPAPILLRPTKPRLGKRQFGGLRRVGGLHLHASRSATCVLVPEPSRKPGASPCTKKEFPPQRPVGGNWVLSTSGCAGDAIFCPR